MLDRWTIRARLQAGFALVIAIQVAAVGATSLQVRDARKLGLRIDATRVPTALEGARLTRGLDQSQAALHAYMILADDAFRHDRADAWERSVEPAMAALYEHAEQWTDPENRKRLEQIAGLVDRLREHQREVEEIAHTDRGSPAGVELRDRARPLAASLIHDITQLIDTEKTLSTSAARRRLLTALSDTRGSLAIAFGRFWDYMRTGEDEDRLAFEQAWMEVRQRQDALRAESETLMPQQRPHFAALADGVEEFEALANRLTASRTKPEWDVARQLLEERASPTARRLASVIDEMIQSQRGLVSADSHAMARGLVQLDWLAWSLLIASALGAAAIGLMLTRAIGRTVEQEVTSLQGASAQARQASVEQTSAAAEQSAATAEVVATMDQLAESARRIVDRCHEVTAQTERAVQACEGGSQSVATAHDVAADVKQRIEAVVEQMLALGKKTQEINVVADVITELSEQTTILSYNAAIEAASAGEAGRSFAAVADQVGRLSDRAKEAVREVRDLIEEVQHSSSRTIMATEDGLKATEVCMSAQNEATATMAQVVTDLSEARRAAHEIELSAAQQSSATEQVKEGTDGVLEAVRQFEESSRQILEMGEQLARSATHLGRL